MPIRTSDSIPNSFVYRFLPAWLLPYAQLARWDRPIGWWLLLWPCLWSFSLAAPALLPDYPTILLTCLVFWVGAVTMRGAGCTYNDLIDSSLDASVSRTLSRPLPSGRLSRRSAWTFLFLQSLVGLLSLIFLVTFRGSPNIFALIVGLCSLPVIAFYPYAKRLTWWPQFFLGLAFSWGIFMGWTIIHATLPPTIFLLYLGCVFWTIGYDTVYAHQDSTDDSPAGIKSTALLFGSHTKLALSCFYFLTVLFLFLGLLVSPSGIFGYLGVFVGGIHLCWQIFSLDITDSSSCLRIFRSNRTFGLLVFLGLSVDIFV